MGAAWYDPSEQQQRVRLRLPRPPWRPLQEPRDGVAGWPEHHLDVTLEHDREARAEGH